MPHATNQGVRIHYRVEGEGPALVLQHGFTWNMDGWARHGYVDALRPHHRLILVDARGHGASDKPHEASAYELSLHVRDIVAVLDALDVPAAHFWGYSMGGWIGFGLAKYAPERARGLILGGAHPYGRSLPSRLDASDPKAFLKGMLSGFGVDFDTLPADKQAEFLDNDFLALAAAPGARPSLQDVLPTMRMACFLYCGELDGTIADTQRCAKEIPHSTFVSFPNLNHPETFYRADVVLPAVMTFLQSAA
jgi:pimeloyl-ACP methyl ester carboxylesterase